MTYLNELAGQLGISLWLLVVIFIWSYVWKLLALWKSARKNHLGWFIILAIVNTIGILEILYIYIFSGIEMKNKKETSTQNKTPKKRKK